MLYKFHFGGPLLKNWDISLYFQLNLYKTIHAINIYWQSKVKGD